MIRLVVTCEHAGNIVPDDIKSLIRIPGKILKSHRGYDKGAYHIFRNISKFSNANIYSRVSRLVIDLNRSLHNQKLFSEYSRLLPDNNKLKLIKSFYQPYRFSVEKTINNFLGEGFKVIHISVHTFTPVLNGIKRNAGIGLLYDPHREAEKEFAKLWKFSIMQKSDNLDVRFNYPYKGKSDGFTKYLRTRFPGKQYIGIELEVNQKFTRKTETLNNTIKTLSQSLGIVLNNSHF